MYFPPFINFQRDFLLFRNSEYDFMWNSLSNGQFGKFSPKTRKNIKIGKIPIGKATEKLLKASIRLGDKFFSMFRKRVEVYETAFPDENEPISIVELDAFTKDSILEGFNLMSVKGDPVFESIFNNVKEHTDLSIQFALAIKNGDPEKVRKIVSTEPLFPEYWAGIDVDGIIDKQENHPHLSLLFLRGFIYQLALIEAFLLSVKPEGTPSQFIHYLLDAGYCTEDCKPLQRFFYALSFNPETNQYKSLNEIGFLIGKRRLEIDVENKKASQDDEELLAAIRP